MEHVAKSFEEEEGGGGGRRRGEEGRGGGRREEEEGGGGGRGYANVRHATNKCPTFPTHKRYFQRQSERRINQRVAFPHYPYSTIHLKRRRIGVSATPT